MRNDRGVGFGVFLLTVGIIWVLWSVGVITWSIINSLFVLWPLILVIIGVNIIFRNNGIIKAVAWVAFLAILISHSYFFEGANNSGDGKQTERKTIVEMLPDTQKGNLRIAFGGTTISMDSNTSNLLEANIQDPGITYTESKNNGEASIAFEKKAYKITSFNNDVKNHNNRFHLNNGIVWDINLDTGAVNGNFDMSGLAVEKLTLNTGAANLRLIFGDKVRNPAVKINAGASKIDIDVPASAGVKIKMDGALNSTNLDGPGWEKKDGSYYSKGYEAAPVKMDMDVSMGVGKLSVNFK